ncbi:hypothetical protein Gotri_001468 [Gossypium trilobum]|uniref:Uncharacterized protein n=1 Tax=Gossypium trilobum TaxID=34281 RepID=A0A7J9FGW9_9ROSI|nr:hypothetical protein [Gossypium trilobum]
MAVEAARMREETRRMNELLRSLQLALREKAKEYEMLKKKKQSMVAKEAPKLKWLMISCSSLLQLTKTMGRMP